MIVLSDCLTNKIDEGCLKVANSLTKRLKKADASTMVISFEVVCVHSFFLFFQEEKREFYSR